MAAVAEATCRCVTASHWKESSLPRSLREIASATCVRAVVTTAADATAPNTEIVIATRRRSQIMT